MPDDELPGERAARGAFVDGLRAKGAITSDAVEEAMRSTPRSIFAPDAAPEELHDDAPILLKVDPAGDVISTISQPSLVAQMIEELELRPGAAVLEVGTASGYNAALLARVVGDAGRVVTIELDADLAEGARDALAAAGCAHVEVVHGDGYAGWPAGAPYDGIVVTAGAPDVSPAWREQLAEGGRLVVPITGPDRRGDCITYAKRDGALVRLRSVPCGFVPLRRG